MYWIIGYIVLSYAMNFILFKLMYKFWEHGPLTTNKEFAVLFILSPISIFFVLILTLFFAVDMIDEHMTDIFSLIGSLITGDKNN